MEKSYSCIGLSSRVSDFSGVLNVKDDNWIMVEIKLSKVLQREIGDRQQTSVAKDVGISKQLLNDWLGARRFPSEKNFPQLYRLAKYFGLTLEELLFDIPASNRKTIAQTIFSDDDKEYKISIERINNGRIRK
jgi:transcriptional regulator with XRE-family HTH domain